MDNPFPLPDKLSPNLQRVFSYWESLERGETNMPFWDDVKLSALPDLADRLLLLDVQADPERFRVNTLGAAAGDQAGALRGKFIDEVALGGRCNSCARRRAPPSRRAPRPSTAAPASRACCCRCGATAVSACCSARSICISAAAPVRLQRSRIMGEWGLVGDIGATNSRLALVGPDGSFSQIRVFACDEFAGLAEMIEAYFSSKARAADSAARGAGGGLADRRRRDQLHQPALDFFHRGPAPAVRLRASARHQ